LCIFCFFLVCWCTHLGFRGVPMDLFRCI
jgi:hypothetical protein